jgi:hypothetical protein
MRPAFPLVLCLALSPGFAGDPPKFDPAADMKRLRGAWETGPASKATAGLKVTDDGCVFRFKGAGFDITMRNSAKNPFDLVEAGGQTLIRVDEKLARLSDLPRDLGYRFDKDELVLTVGSGPAKGEYRLTKTGEK